jgi:DNA-binding transcriptional LysR family regulator
MTPRGGGPDPSGERDQWLGVELRHLAALAAVARERSFRGAADSLGYVQSAVSQQIAFLERLVGMRLVERSRGPRPVSLTDAGTLLLGHVDGILRQLRAAQADLDALAEGQTGTLRVGVHKSIATRVVAMLLAGYARQWPDVQVTTRESSTERELTDLVETGGLDIALADLPLPPGPFTSDELLLDPYVLLVQAGTRLARRGKLSSPGELSGLSLIGHGDGRMSTRIEAQLQEHGVEPKFAFRSDITATAQALVGAGIGAAILPRLSVDPGDPATAIVPLGALLEPRRVGLFWHREHAVTAPMEGFRDIARDICAELNRHTVVSLNR